MGSSLQQPPVRTSFPKAGMNGSGNTGWKALFKRTIVVVLAVSLAIHVLLLLAFGSVAIFKGSLPKLPFVSQQIADTTVAEVPAPPAEEEPKPVEESTTDPFAQETADSSPAEDSAPALDMLTVVDGAKWAPTIPKNTPVSETGVIGGTGKGTGLGGGRGGGGGGGGKQLFGVSIQARKLGVIADLSGSMQTYLPKVMEEILKNFSDADVVFVNGCGMMDWEEALKKFEEEKAEKEKTAQEGKQKYTGPKSMPKPKVVKFNGPEASDAPPIRGTSQYGGLRKDYPELYEKMVQRSNTWMVTSFVAAQATGLAFDHLAKRKVEAIYWFADFKDPIEGQVAEQTAQMIKDTKIEVLLHPVGSIRKAEEWSKKVNAKVISKKL